MLDGWQMDQQLMDGLISFLNTIAQTSAPHEAQFHHSSLSAIAAASHTMDKELQ